MADDPLVPLAELSFEFVRGSGPGGQNVNKVSTKAILRWPVAASRSLAADVRARFLERFASRITGAGEILIACDRHRDRERNREDCLERLRRMLAEVARPPRPRKKTRPPRNAVERRLREKRRRAEQKLGRMFDRSRVATEGSD